MGGWFRALFFAVIASWTVHASVASAAECSTGEIAQAAAGTAHARNALIALPIGDGLVTDVSRQAQDAIAATKSRLAELVAAYMRCAPTTRSAATIRRDLSRLTHAYRMKSTPGIHPLSEKLPPNSGHYGFELWVKTRRWGDGPDAPMGITVEFSIECGVDAVLFIFRPEHDGWTEALQWSSKPYKTVGGAFADFDYAVAPPDSSGQWYVVTKSVAPWCSSTWSAIRYAALRPTAVAGSPRVLHEGEDDMWWGNEDFGRIWANRSVFEIRFHSYSIDTGVHNRVWIRRFRVDGDRAVRIQPVAESPRDFADEWIVSPWRDAAAWSEARAPSRLKSLHQQLEKIRFHDFGSVRTCRDRRDHYQVALVDPDTDDREQYFLSVIGRRVFLLTKISTAPDPLCNGENIIDTMQTK